MKKRIRIRLNTWEWIYASMWCLLLLGATFPSIFLSYDFSFLNESGEASMYGISKSYMFAVVMVVVIHLLDVANVIITTKIAYNKMRWGFFNTLISMIVIFISLIFVTSVESFYVKIFWFTVFWILLFVYKILCIKMTKSIDVKMLKVINIV